MLRRNAMVPFQLDDVIRMPANNQYHEKSSDRFTINDRS